MTDPPLRVFDASALLAFLRGEPGSAVVEAALRDRGAVSAVNFEEVLSKMADLGSGLDSTLDRLAEEGILPGSIRIVPLDEAGARESARLRDSTRSARISLGDRACLSLARTLDAPVLTADRAWLRAAPGVKVVLIR